jgi:hypothetical protein
VSAFTTNFQLEFLAPGEPVRNTRAILQRMAESVDAALTRGGIAPAATQVLVGLPARTTALEGRATTLEGRTALPPATAPAVTYGPGFGPYTDATVGWSGVRYWRNGGTVTVSGAFATTAATANLAVLATLPVGFRPPATVQEFGGTYVRSDGRILINGAKASGYVAAFLITYAAAAS